MTQADKNTPTADDHPIIPLEIAPAGETLELAAIAGGRRLQHRLAEMGLTPGVRFRIITKGQPGPFIISVKETRLVLGRGMAHSVTVRRTSG